MPIPEDYDDYDDRPSRSSVPFPTGVKAAGIIWICFGILGLINTGLSFAINAANAAAAGGQGQGSVCSGGCGILFAIAFLVVGVQTVKGTAKGTLGNGIGSIVFGLLYSGLTILAIALIGRFPGGPVELMYLLAGISAILALALLTAGFLAISGRDAYQEWRVANGLGPRPRPRTVEQEDYDDRPRRPRRDRDDDDDRPRRDRDDDR